MLLLLSTVGFLTITSVLCLLLLKLLLAWNEKHWRLIPIGDCLWVVGPLGYYGRCCPQCFFQYAARPASTTDGPYELICPVCFYRTKTLLTRRQLMELEQKAERRFSGRRLGISLGELLELVPGENPIPATRDPFFLN